jgi:hypothetical protein
MGQQDKPTSPGRIESLDREVLEARLRDVARGLFPDRIMDDLEVRHLVRVLKDCALLLGDVYSEDRIAQVIRPGRDPVGHLMGRLIQQAVEADDVLLRVRRLPDEVRVVGDKALFDHGLRGLRQVKGYDLVQLGAQAYRRAGELLELLAEDRRLRQFFKDNRLLMLPLEEEVVFLNRCSEEFLLYADILKHTHALGDPVDDETVAEMVSRVPLMAAAVEALGRREIERPSSSDRNPESNDVYVEAARGESPGDVCISKERLISSYERVLLFSALDMPRLEAALNATVIDQQQAVDRLCDDFSLFAAGTRDPSKPPAYFLLGPTGVGKNHLVETLVRLLEGVWGIEVPTLTIEGPNYTYPSDINELRGATRGFIRSDEEGILTTFHEKASRAPVGVIIVDEVEKAHSHLLTFFLSILDRGTTTDNRGNVLNLSNCMLFFTSNLGYSEAQRQTRPIGYLDDDERSRASDGIVRRGLRGGLRPEFLNRVRTIHFNRLGPASAERILGLELDRVARRYRELHALRIELSPSARAELIRRGFSPVYGARHLASTLDAVCNVDIAKKVREDDRGDATERKSLLQWLREMRAGERAFAPEEVKQRVLERARAQLDYDTLVIDFRDGRFEYLTEGAS